MDDEAPGQFSVRVEDDFIYMRTWGELDVDHLEDPATAALALAKEKGITKLLDDIREVDPADATIQVQSKGMGVVWKLRAFEKVAIIFGSQELAKIFFAALEAMHITSRVRGFYGEEEAIAWLKSDAQD